MVSNILYVHPDPWGFMIQFAYLHIFQMGGPINHLVLLMCFLLGGLLDLFRGAR